MNHLDLFSGIGGFSLGLKEVFNIKHTYYSEIDKYAIDVYKHNFKNSTYVHHCFFYYPQLIKY